ncbi:DUF952 domain-containing protein [Candidatus Saccharibacteria bacterium]|nr:DUF952 domain-containing protein [Candidatus Saccharibacteria bacterium]
MDVYHIALKKDWLKAKEDGVYAISTLNKIFDEVGFIHLSHHDQIPLIASSIYSNITEPLVVLKLDSEKLDSQLLKQELSGGEYFPHYYGTIDPNWVVDVIPLTKFK